MAALQQSTLRLTCVPTAAERAHLRAALDLAIVTDVQVKNRLFYLLKQRLAATSGSGRVLMQAAHLQVAPTGTHVLH